MPPASPAAGAGRSSRPPDSFDALQGLIAGRYDRLSRRLQEVAQYALAHPDDVALETIAVIAGRARVPPSSLIRFAKALGFDGFTEMQRLFRARLVERAPSYSERIKGLRGRHERTERAIAAAVLQDFATASVQALDRLRRDVPGDRLERAIELLAAAEVIYVAGQRRAFPVAAYLSYLLSQLERRSHLLDSLGGMLEQQARGIGPRDLLLAVSFRTYAPEVLALVERSAARGVPVVAITDGPLSPLLRHADVGFEVVEAEVEGFRPLSASMCLALSLVVALGHQLNRPPPLADGQAR
jgi:DNA-binding MurR/RpiR family transcriptional regulator